MTDPQFAKGWPDVARFAIYVWRAERYGGDTKTGKSRWTLALPKRALMRRESGGNGRSESGCAQ